MPGHISGLSPLIRTNASACISSAARARRSDTSSSGPRKHRTESSPHSPAIASSSFPAEVATTISPIRSAVRSLSMSRASIGRPARGRRTFPGSRAEDTRAWMTASTSVPGSSHLFGDAPDLDANVVHVLGVEMRPYRQRDRAIADAGGHGESAVPPAVFSAVVRHTRHRLRVVDACSDAFGIQPGDEFGPFLCKRRIKNNREAIIAARETPLRRLQLPDARYARKRLGQDPVVAFARGKKPVHLPELHAADGGLNFVHAVVESERHNVICTRYLALTMGAIHAECLAKAQTCGKFGVPRNDHAAFCRSHVLDGVEGKYARIAVQTGVDAVESGSDRKRAILHHKKLMPAGH